MLLMTMTILMSGAMRWVQTLSWPGLDGYNSADRQTLIDPDRGRTEAFVKAHDRLKFYWILDAGHSVGGLGYRLYLYCHSRSAGAGAQRRAMAIMRLGPSNVFTKFWNG